MADETEFDPLEGLFTKPDPEAPGGGDDAGSQQLQQRQEAPVVEPPTSDGEGEVTGAVKMVPLAALEEARTRAKSAEERLAASQAPAKATTPAADADTPVQLRNPTEDPAGAYEDLAGVMRLEVVNTKLNLSEDMAREKHGDELVDKVQAWALAKFDTDPAFASRILNDRNPFKTAIGEYNSSQRQEKAELLPDDVLEGLDEEELAAVRAIRAKKAADAGGDQGSGGAGTPKPQPRSEGGQFTSTPPPRKQSAPAPKSLATTSAATGNRDTVRPVGEGAAFQDTFLK